MEELEGCIRFWESTLEGYSFTMAIETIGLVKSTIKLLKELQKVKENGRIKREG